MDFKIIVSDQTILRMANELGWWLERPNVRGAKKQIKNLREQLDNEILRVRREKREGWNGKG